MTSRSSVKGWTTTLLLIAGCELCCVASAQDTVRVFVDAQSASASDENAGTMASPLLTVTAAAKHAAANKAVGISTVVVVRPGTYREGPIKFDSSDYPRSENHASDASISVSVVAETAGSAVISGSDVYDNWNVGTRPGLFEHSWPNRWGVAPNPWKGDRKVADLVLRREMVFVDGERLEQVITRSDLAPGRFYVDDGLQKLIVDLGTDSSPEAHQIEVAVRSTLWDQNVEDDVFLRGLVFEHAATPWTDSQAAVRISGSSRVKIESCEIRQNNWQGLHISESSAVRIRNTRMNDNGGQGWGMFRIRDLEAVGNETSNNNWRGALGDFTGWSVGNKLLSVHGGRISGHTSTGNHSRGLWLDYDLSEIVLDSVNLSNNDRDGLYIEAVQGPVTVRNSLLAANGESGLRSAFSRAIVLEGNQFTDNRQGQIQFDGTGDRTVTDFETREAQRLHLGYWVIAHNVFRGSTMIETAQPFKRGDWKRFTAQLVMDENSFGGSSEPMFRIPAGALGLDAWRQATGHDLRSRAAQD